MRLHGEESQAGGPGGRASIFLNITFISSKYMHQGGGVGRDFELPGELVFLPLSVTGDRAIRSVMMGLYPGQVPASSGLRMMRLNPPLPRPPVQCDIRAVGSVFHGLLVLKFTTDERAEVGKEGRSLRSSKWCDLVVPDQGFRFPGFDDAVLVERIQFPTAGQTWIDCLPAVVASKGPADGFASGRADPM